MKRLSLYLFLIFFTFPTPSQADDIRDFQIEGMSVGDSLLNFLSESEIKQKKKTIYKNKKFSRVELPPSTLKVYDGSYIDFKTDDRNYEIKHIVGQLYYNNNIYNCYKKKDKIVNELKELFKNNVQIKDIPEHSHKFDKTGNSKIKKTHFIFNSGAVSQISCTDWSKKIEQDEGIKDSLKVTVTTHEYVNFLINEAYK